MMLHMHLRVKVPNGHPFLEGNIGSKYSFEDAYHSWFTFISRNAFMRIDERLAVLDALQ